MEVILTTHSKKQEKGKVKLYIANKPLVVIGQFDLYTKDFSIFHLIILFSTHPVAVGVKLFLGASAGVPIKVVGALSIID